MMAFFAQKRVYMDYASAPPVLPEAVQAMRKTEEFAGNPGAIHAEGVRAFTALEAARSAVARELEVKAREIIFTSGLTESNNLAILGFTRLLERTQRTLERTHWIASAIEHTSVLDCFAEIERLGGSVSFVSPAPSGRIAPESVAAQLRDETVLVSVGWANNEIGTVQDLRKIRAVLDGHRNSTGKDVLLHSDAGQAPLYQSNTAHSLGVDLMSIGGNKLYGPHGVGALYINNRANLAKILQGGPQERRLRAGTESVALAAGFAAAYKRIAGERKQESVRLREIRNNMANSLAAALPGLVINGDLEYALPHMLSVSIPNIQSEYVTLSLDRAGIAVSTKSACREGEESESHVVAALFADRGPGSEKKWRSRNTLRLSIGRDTTEKDAQRAVRLLIEIVHTRAE